MASPVGLAIRNEKAQQRINDALALLSESFGIDLPDDPPRTRDPFLREMLRLEWTAETLEVLAAASIGRIEPLAEEELEGDSDEQSDQEPEQNGTDSEQTALEEEQADEGPDPDGEAEPEDDSQSENPDEELDAAQLKKLKLDDLKAMAAERGIDDVQDARAKDEVIEKLMEGSE